MEGTTEVVAIESVGGRVAGSQWRVDGMDSAAAESSVSGGAVGGVDA